MMVRMTQTNISSERRLQIKETVYNALLHSNTCNLPIKIKAIVRSYKNIRLISYSKHMKKFNISYEKMKTYAQTKDAFTDYYTSKNLYCIYYNDLDTNIVTSNRYRWNIAHELGHVLLDHHKTNDKTRIFRCTLSDKEYNILEEEADYFAQLILVPHAALYGLKINDARSLKIICKISNPASRKRYYEYHHWLLSPATPDEYDKRIFCYYYNFIYKRQCKTCGASFIQRYGKYCSICGNKTIQWGDGNMIYPKLETYENGKLLECPRCKNEETNLEGDYCQICGRSIVNYCSSDDCSKNPLPSNARYCPICGNHSTFYDLGFLNDWNYTEPGSGFMNIPDPVDESLPFYQEEELPFD